MKREYILFVLAFIFMGSVQCQRTRKRVKPVTDSLYHFEDVDWQKMPKNIRDERNDCHGHFLRCVRALTIMQWVCAIDVRTSYYGDYYSVCEIDVENCMHRIYHNPNNILGYPYDTYAYVRDRDPVVHNGEGKGCVHYFHMYHPGSTMGYDLWGGRRSYPSTPENHRKYFGKDYEMMVPKINYLTNLYAKDNKNNMKFNNNYNVRGNYSNYRMGDYSYNNKFNPSRAPYVYNNNNMINNNFNRFGVATPYN